MQQSGLDKRHHNAIGEISRKRGNTLIGILRKIYGEGFAPGLDQNMTLGDALPTMDVKSLSQIMVHFEDDTLPRRIAVASTML